MKIPMTKREKIFGWIFLASTPLALPYAVVAAMHLLQLKPDDAQLNVLVFILDFGLTLLIFHRFLWKNAKHSFHMPGKTFMWMGIGFGAYNAGSYLVVSLTMLLAPDFANANDANIMAMLQEHFWPMFFCTVVLVPITEETLYRGLVVGSLRKKCRWLAYAVSILAFSALHVIGYIGTLSPLHLFISFLQYLPGAAALALAYDMSDSIWPGILIHTTINLLAILSMTFLR